MYVNHDTKYVETNMKSSDLVLCCVNVQCIIIPFILDISFIIGRIIRIQKTTNIIVIGIGIITVDINGMNYT